VSERQTARETTNIGAAECPGPVEIIGQRIHQALELPRQVLVGLTAGGQLYLVILPAAVQAIFG
jgi:hypothetical protein